MKLTKEQFKELIKESIVEAKNAKFNTDKMEKAIQILLLELYKYNWGIDNRDYKQLKYILELFNKTSNSSYTFDTVVLYLINHGYTISDTKIAPNGYTQLYNALVKASKVLK